MVIHFSSIKKKIPGKLSALLLIYFLSLSRLFELRSFSTCAPENKFNLQKKNNNILKIIFLLFFLSITNVSIRAIDAR